MSLLIGINFNSELRLYNTNCVAAAAAAKWKKLCPSKTCSGYQEVGLFKSFSEHCRT